MDYLGDYPCSAKLAVQSFGFRVEQALATQQSRRDTDLLKVAVT